MYKKTNIIFYTGHCEIVGGDAKYLFELINNLNSDKYNIKVFTDINSVFEERADQWLKKDISIQYIDTRPKLFNRMNNALDVYDSVIENKYTNNNIFSRMSKLLNKIIDRINGLLGDIHNYLLFKKIFEREGGFDIFHFNNGGYPGKTAGIWALLAAKRSGIKSTIMTLQNLPVNRKYLWYIPDYYDYLYDWLTRSCCDVIITVAGEKLQRKMNEERKYPKKRLKTIYHGLEDHKSSTLDQVRKKEELGIPLSSRVLIITANIEEPRKGHSVLFHALAYVTSKYPETLLLVVGDGTKKEELIRLCNDLLLEKNIMFLGHRIDVAELNDITDLAIVPSIGFEGLPYTIREAMRSGRPVITTKAGGCEEAVENQLNGLIVKENDSRDLAEAIITILDDKNLCLKMGKESRKLFLKKFLLEDKIREHEKLYDQIVIEN